MRAAWDDNRDGQDVVSIQRGPEDVKIGDNVRVIVGY